MQLKISENLPKASRAGRILIFYLEAVSCSKTTIKTFT